jgi:hypothetical protein
MAELSALLAQLDAAIRSAQPKFHARLKPAATEAELSALRAALGVLPPAVETWFRWHAGSTEGIHPDTSVALIEPSEAVRELKVLKEIPPDRELPPGACPLMTDSGGGLWILAGEALWTYDRGDITDTKPFLAALETLVEEWKAEASTIRAEFVRTGRSMLGWREIVLPLKVKKPLLAQLKTLTDGSSVVVRAISGAVSLRCISEQAPGGDPEICLTRAQLDELGAALQHEDSAPVPGAEELRLAFSRQ